MSKDKSTQLKKGDQVKKGKGNQVNQPVTEDQSKEEAKQQEFGVKGKIKAAEKQKQQMSKEGQFQIGQENQMQQLVKHGQEEVFADPTYDLTFKMLFGNDKNKDILISFLNNILGFKGDKEILDVEINSNELLGDSNKSIQSNVDILCTVKNKQKIAIEMQRVYEDYFLAREQEYMSKIISQQVTSGQSNKYHEALLDTYIVIITKENVFPDRQPPKKEKPAEKDKIKLQNFEKFQEVYTLDKNHNTEEIYYYKEVVPMIKGYNIEIPDNKMHWVFCELSKFKKQHKNQEITGDDTLKKQWLDFLINAQDKVDIPSDLDVTIKRGYEIMKSVLIEEDTRILYWKEKSDRALHEQVQEDKEAEAFEKGKWKGEVKGEITQFKNFQKLKLQEEQYKDMFKYLKQDNFPYIKEHIDDNESVIMGGMDIEYQDEL